MAGVFKTILDISVYASIFAIFALIIRYMIGKRVNRFGLAAIRRAFAKQCKNRIKDRSEKQNKRKDNYIRI